MVKFYSEILEKLKNMESLMSEDGHHQITNAIERPSLSKWLYDYFWK